MLELKENSARVIDGKIVKQGGIIVNLPCMLVYGDELVSWGDLDNLTDSLLAIHHKYELRGIDIEHVRLFGFDMRFAKDFNIHDVCYVIRRGEELPKTGFLLEVAKRWNSRSFWDWVKEERKIYPIQTE